MRIPELTPELLRELGAELGGCAFDDENQLAFLKSVGSCDVQAAPGNGKTTLLVAKLALLSRTWRDRDRGVCVISHTNAAREEVQKRLGAHPTASAFLGYPHFIGTVTAFIDQFVALPYLRGLGWRVRRIDDEVFAAKAKAMIAIKPKLRWSATAGRRSYQVESWCAGLTLGDGFDQAAAPERVAVQAVKGQPGAHAPSGKELEEIKASLVRLGVYRFDDMHVVARHALKETPHLAARLRARFPLAILDEAQDTNGELLGMLDTIFQGGALQRLGDQNQTLYEDGAAVARYWTPGEASLPLDVTRRFGPDIARFASRLTARKPQVIRTSSERRSHRLLIGFDRSAIEDVLPRFAEWTAARLGEKARRADIRAVASRHNLYRETIGGWPKSLTDYHPHYRSGGGRGASGSTFCGSMRAMAAKHAAGQTPHDTQAAMAAALADYLQHRGLQLDSGQRIRGGGVWPALAAISQDHPLRVRKLLIEHVLHGRAADDPHLWDRFCQALLSTLPDDLSPYGDYCAFEPEGAVAAAHVAESRAQLRFGEIQVRLGSIHSVKGMSVDALLLMETEIRRGQASTDRAMDLETALPHAFGLEERDFTASDAMLAAATNVFVAVTRPRDLLALAVRDDAVPAALWTAASDQGWEILRLTQG